MPHNPAYDIVEATSIEELSDKVNLKYTEGYAPYGSLIAVPQNDKENTTYFYRELLQRHLIKELSK